MQTFGFIVAACTRTVEHAETLKQCIQSLDNYQVVIIVDFTSNMELIDEISKQFPKVLFERNTPKVPADMLLLSYFYEKKYFDVAILLQDSMRLIQPIPADLILSSKINYIWHFTNHRLHWSLIKEPQTPYNIMNKIETHDDLIIHLINLYVEDKTLKDYLIKEYWKKNTWSGSLGCSCVIAHKELCVLQEKTHIIELMSKMTDNRRRRAMESLFPLCCSYHLGGHQNFSFDGLYYDGKYHNNFKGKYIFKVTFDRQ